MTTEAKNELRRIVSNLDNETIISKRDEYYKKVSEALEGKTVSDLFAELNIRNEKTDYDSNMIVFFDVLDSEKTRRTL
uniref:Uncharacterized protein n=1 Tax=viral metagenome TaxID=1070528 RepID=A0A6H2A0Z6_9ZZZZ